MAAINPWAVWSPIRRIDFDDLQGNTGETLLVCEGRVSEPEALLMRFDAEQSVCLPGTFHDHENASLVLGYVNTGCGAAISKKTTRCPCINIYADEDRLLIST